MRLLFDMDKKDYNPDGKKFVRPSVRGIIIKNGKIAMVHSIKYNYYKFPGGGIEGNENKIETLIREVREESGLIVKADTIKEYGNVHRIQKSDQKDYDVFVQDNFYYICDTEQNICTQNLDDYEKEENYTLEFIDPQKAIQVNRYENHGQINQDMLEREALVLELLIKDGFL